MQPISQSKFKSPVFPSQLYNILNSTEIENIIDVTLDGLCFKVLNVDRFETEIMPKHFKTTDYRSFQRQLTKYGCQQNMDGYYYHPDCCFNDPKTRHNLTNVEADTHSYMEVISKCFSKISAFMGKESFTSEEIKEKIGKKIAESNSNPNAIPTWDGSFQDNIISRKKSKQLGGIENMNSTGSRTPTSKRNLSGFQPPNQRNKKSRSISLGNLGKNENGNDGQYYEDDSMPPYISGFANNTFDEGYSDYQISGDLNHQIDAADRMLLTNSSVVDGTQLKQALLNRKLPWDKKDEESSEFNHYSPRLNNNDEKFDNEDNSNYSNNARRRTRQQSSYRSSSSTAPQNEKIVRKYSDSAIEEADDNFILTAAALMTKLKDDSVQAMLSLAQGNTNETEVAAK